MNIKSVYRWTYVKQYICCILYIHMYFYIDLHIYNWYVYMYYIYAYIPKSIYNSAWHIMNLHYIGL